MYDILHICLNFLFDNLLVVWSLESVTKNEIQIVKHKEILLVTYTDSMILHFESSDSVTKALLHLFEGWSSIVIVSNIGLSISPYKMPTRDIVWGCVVRFQYQSRFLWRGRWRCWGSSWGPPPSMASSTYPLQRWVTQKRTWKVEIDEQF